MSFDSARPPSPPQALPAGVAWVPDEEAFACCICHAEFTQVRRKHHCRLCGRIACNECSLGRARLPNFSEKQRVCDECEYRNRGDATLAIADEIRVTQEITSKMKVLLKEKVDQVEKFKTFLLSMHPRDRIDGPGQDFDELLRNGEEEVKNFAREIEEEKERRRVLESELAEMKKKYGERQQDAQKLAARVLRAESMLDDRSKDEMEKNELARQVTEHQKTIDALLERLRAGDGSVASVSMPPLPESPRDQREEIIANGRTIDELGAQRCFELYGDLCKRRCEIQ